MKRSFIAELIVALFILLFLYTGMSKLQDLDPFRDTLSRSPLIKSMAFQIGWILPVIEIVISILLFIPLTKRLGLWCSLVLMLVFTVYLSYMIYFTSDRPCSCGGVLKQMTWKQHLLFNIFFTLLALCGLWFNRKHFLQNVITPKHSILT